MRRERSDQLERLLTIRDASDILRVSSKTIRRLIKKGTLAAHLIGRQWRIAPADLQRLLRDTRN